MENNGSLLTNEVEARNDEAVEWMDGDEKVENDVKT